MRGRWTVWQSGYCYFHLKFVCTIYISCYKKLKGISSVQHRKTVFFLYCKERILKSWKVHIVRYKLRMIYVGEVSRITTPQHTIYVSETPTEIIQLNQHFWHSKIKSFTKVDSPEAVPSQTSIAVWSLLSSSVQVWVWQLLQPQRVHLPSLLSLPSFLPSFLPLVCWRTLGPHK